MSDSSTPDARTLDPEMILELRALDTQGPPFLDALIRAFLRDSQSELAAIVEAIDAADLQRSHLIAHGLKGSSHMIGAHRLASAAARIERASRDADIGEAHSHLPALLHEHREACRALEDLT